jgi:hypothetical protein
MEITELLDGRNTPAASCPATQAGIDLTDRWQTMLRRERRENLLVANDVVRADDHGFLL